MPHLGRRMHLPHFSLQLSSKKGGNFHRDLPKGCIALDVGQEEEERRCVEYMNYALFRKFLKNMRLSTRVESPFHVISLIFSTCRRSFIEKVMYLMPMYAPLID
ncbi:hypothetical protein SUGI_1168730 [Cryptomeria japonica]|nr:hypothetical protein SUGI_1168730 [Cryptomeria japonica]